MSKDGVPNLPDLAALHGQVVRLLATDDPTMSHLVGTLGKIVCRDEDGDIVCEFGDERVTLLPGFDYYETAK